MPGKILHHYEKSSLSTIIFVKSREKYRLAIDLSDHQTIRLFSVQWEDRRRIFIGMGKADEN